MRRRQIDVDAFEVTRLNRIPRREVLIALVPESRTELFGCDLGESRPDHEMYPRARS